MELAEVYRGFIQSPKQISGCYTADTSGKPCSQIPAQSDSTLRHAPNSADEWVQLLRCGPRAQGSTHGLETG
jgi:hypothetical protein